MSSQDKTCLRCGKNSLVTDIESQEIVCSNCGLVVDEKVTDRRPDRTFSDSVNKSHTGDKSTLIRHDRGLSTVINSADKDSSGNTLSASMRSSIGRLRKWDSRSRVKTSDDRNLRHALGEILKLKEKLSLSDAIAEKAAYIYRKALDKSLIRGRSILAVVAASMYAACRESETPRTLDEVADAIGIRRKEVTTSYRLIFRELELRMPVVDSVSCISKIASNADVSEKIKRDAIKILKKAEKENILAGKHPMGVAASALYLAGVYAGDIRTQKDIADAAGITEVTVRNRCKSLRQVV
ncbi:transcription initiation factor IIB [Nitrosopumilus sp. K4]|uniref:transcription initiation factor IIB n=1 Tax=Nitrosopumilus sp. K4 TaxID=2795383 RepID=UPI001BA4D1CD|nr:TFIIB-type zinc ribbon-containing protein [Nitrosopumilus sp. K4]QUC64146.1 transcription initiation factor IIB [Nitrosopumilus sp. K4]